MSTHPADLLDEISLSIIFGEESRGATPEERADTSPQLWVRDQDHLALYTPGATGLLMSAREALNAFGLAKMYEAIDYGCAIIIHHVSEPGTSLRKRRYELNLDQYEVAEHAGVNIDDVIDCESARSRSDIHAIAKICRVIGLDPISIGHKPYTPPPAI